MVELRPYRRIKQLEGELDQERAVIEDLTRQRDAHRTEKHRLKQQIHVILNEPKFLCVAGTYPALQVLKNNGVIPPQTRYISTPDQLRGHGEGTTLFVNWSRGSIPRLVGSKLEEMIFTIGHLKQNGGEIVYVDSDEPGVVE